MLYAYRLHVHALAVTAASVLTHYLAAADARDAMTPAFTTSIGAFAFMALTTTLAPAGILCNRVCVKIASWYTGSAIPQTPICELVQSPMLVNCHGLCQLLLDNCSLALMYTMPCLVAYEDSTL